MAAWKGQRGPHMRAVKRFLRDFKGDSVGFVLLLAVLATVAFIGFEFYSGWAARRP
jgi:hypothetical protein